MALPSLAAAHCDSIEITGTSWESSSSTLAMTFTSKPGKIYEVQGSPDLAGFSPVTDVARIIHPHLLLLPFDALVAKAWMRQAVRTSTS